MFVEVSLIFQTGLWNPLHIFIYLSQGWTKWQFVSGYIIFAVSNSTTKVVFVYDFWFLHQCDSTFVRQSEKAETTILNLYFHQNSFFIDFNWYTYSILVSWQRLHVPLKRILSILPILSWSLMKSNPNIRYFPI